MTKKKSSEIFTLKMDIFPEIGPRKIFLVPPSSAPGLRPCSLSYSPTALLASNNNTCLSFSVSLLFSSLPRIFCELPSLSLYHSLPLSCIPPSFSTPCLFSSLLAPLPIHSFYHTVFISFFFLSSVSSFPSSTSPSAFSAFLYISSSFCPFVRSTMHVSHDLLPLCPWFHLIRIHKLQQEIISYIYSTRSKWLHSLFHYL